MAFKWKNFFNLRKSTPTYVEGAHRYLRGKDLAANVTHSSSMTVSAFYRGVVYISSQMAKLPWEVKDKDNNIITDGNVPYLLDTAPNPEMNTMLFRLLAISTALQHGNFYAEIERDGGGRALNIWPLKFQNVTPVRSTSGQLFYRVTGDNAKDSGTVYLNPSDVFHLRNLHTLDGIMGESLLNYAARTLGISIAADEMAGGIFANSGLPSGVVEVPTRMSDEAFQRLEEDWHNQHGGRKTGGTAILEEGAKFNPINITPDVLQFLESRKFGVIELARFLGLPPHKLGDTTKATYSNVEQANLEVATDTLHAWAVNMELEADMKLLGRQFAGRYTALDLYEITRADMATRADYYTKMMQAASITPNQIRALEGKPGYGNDGDQYYIASNNFTPVSRQNELIDATIKQKTAPKTVAAPADNADPKDTETDKQLKLAALKLLEK